MILLMQLLKEAGADTDKAFTVILGYGGYFKAIKRVAEYAPQKVTLGLGKGVLVVSGENLRIDKYFEGDLWLLGDIRGIALE